MNKINNSLSETILALGKEKSSEFIKDFLKEYDDTEVFSALCELKAHANEKIDIIRAEYLLLGKGCKKSETEAGNLFSKIVSYLEKRNEFPPEYALACYKAASLLYDKANAFELNLGFAIDYDRRGSLNGGSNLCRKRYEKNICFFKNLLPYKYPNEEMLYKVAAFVLCEQDKKHVLDNYWNALREKVLRTQTAYLIKYFSPDASDEELHDAEEIIEKNHSFPDGCELYQKEESKKSRPSITATGEKKSDFFSKVSTSYYEYEKALCELFKTRMACQRKTNYEEKLGEQDFEFWSSEEKVSRALNILKRRETYEGIFGIQTPDFWENDDIFFKYVDALSRKKKFENILGVNDWDFWLCEEKVKKAAAEFKEKQSAKLKKHEKNIKIKKFIIALICFIVLYFVFYFVLFLFLRSAFISLITAFFLSLTAYILLYKKINGCKN
ncbi:MAG: hypothetical protein E7407_05570 [Ruminococcaceae bacterium]|nr:hypothetical protein [Oscillospiraceae bacterium]